MDSPEARVSRQLCYGIHGEASGEPRGPGHGFFSHKMRAVKAIIPRGLSRTDIFPFYVPLGEKRQAGTQSEAKVPCGSILAWRRDASHT